jgi:hypothetical protein
VHTNRKTKEVISTSSKTSIGVSPLQSLRFFETSRCAETRRMASDSKSVVFQPFVVEQERPPPSLGSLQIGQNLRVK